ncbi:hypothetical protein C2E31_24765 [Rhodopirellula baltica]|nr:hypothetical protein C2E31_24765 [Rhodopirellula baltica]
MKCLPHEKAETFRRFARNYRDADISFDRGGVEWLDMYIDSLHDNATDLENEQRIFALGCFFGVCLAETVGGEWSLVGDRWCFVSCNSSRIDPFDCIRSQMRPDRSDSLVVTFDTVINATEASGEPDDAAESPS